MNKYLLLACMLSFSVCSCASEQDVKNIQDVIALVKSGDMSEDTAVQRIARESLTQEDVDRIFDAFNAAFIKKLWSIHPALTWIVDQYKETLTKFEYSWGQSFVRGNYFMFDRVGAVQIWNINNLSEQPIELPYGFHGDAADVAIDPQSDTIYISGRSAHKIRTWNLKDISKPQPIFVGAPPYSKIVLSSDGKYLFTWPLLPFEGSVEMWDTATFKKIREFPKESYGAFIISGGSTLITWKDDGSIQFINTANGNKIKTLTHKLDPHQYALTSVGVSPSEKYLVSYSPGKFAAQKGILRVWDIQAGKELYSFEVNLDIKLSSEGFQEKVVRARGEEQMSQLMVISPDEKYIVLRRLLNAPDTAAVYEFKTGKKVAQFTYGQDNRFVFSPDAKYLMTLSGKIWDMDTISEDVPLSVDFDVFELLMFSNKNLLITCYYRKVGEENVSFRVWDYKLLDRLLNPTVDEIYFYLQAYAQREYVEPEQSWFEWFISLFTSDKKDSKSAYQMPAKYKAMYADIPSDVRKLLDSISPNLAQ